MNRESKQHKALKTEKKGNKAMKFISKNKARRMNDKQLSLTLAVYSMEANIASRRSPALRTIKEQKHIDRLFQSCDNMQEVQRNRNPQVIQFV